MVAVLLWGQFWRGRRIQLFCDNEAVVSVINTGRTKDAVLATCLREIWLQSARGEFELRQSTSLFKLTVLQTIFRVGIFLITTASPCMTDPLSI